MCEFLLIVYDLSMNNPGPTPQKSNLVVRKRKYNLAACCLFTLLLGCDRGDVAPRPPHPPVTTPQNSVLVVVGDETLETVKARLREAGILILDVQPLGDSPLLIVAQDASKGMQPVHRELIQNLAHTDFRRVLWILTEANKIDDAELLELQELEARELLAEHFSEDAIKFAIDTDTSPSSVDSSVLRGWDAIVKYVSAK